MYFRVFLSKTAYISKVNWTMKAILDKIKLKYYF